MKRVLLSLVIMGTALGAAWAQYPGLVIGLEAEPVIAPDDAGAVDTWWGIEAEAVFSLRTIIGEASYFALLLKGRGGVVPGDPLLMLDEELASAEAGLAAGPGRFTLKALYRSSFNGNLIDDPYITPEWELKYHFSIADRMINPYVSYSGFVKTRPADNEDTFLEKIECGFEYRPSFLEEYRLSLAGGWESWYETTLYTSAGGVDDEFRNDFFCTLTGKAGGVIDFFLNWDLELAGTLLFSNANQYIAAAALLNDGSEDALHVSLTAGLDWSPSRAVTLKLKPKAGIKTYFNRVPLAETGAMLDGRTVVFFAGGTAECAWSPADPLHFILKADITRDFSNDAELDTWRMRASIGLKVNLNISGTR